jgi:hypothetical protein
MQYLNNVLATGTSNQLAVSGEQLTGNGTFTPTAEQERRQFLTLITGKDPNMVAAMNADAVSGNLFNNLNSKNPPADSRYISPGNCAGTSCSNCTYGYICGAEEKRLSNIVTALYLYKNGCQTAGTPPTP